MRLCLLLLIILPFLIEGKQIPRKAKSSSQREGNKASVDIKDEAGTDSKDDASEKNEDEPHEEEDEATDGFRNGYGYKKGYRNKGYKKGYRNKGYKKGYRNGLGSGETPNGSR